MKFGSKILHAFILQSAKILYNYFLRITAHSFYLLEKRKFLSRNLLLFLYPNLLSELIPFFVINLPIHPVPISGWRQASLSAGPPMYKGSICKQDTRPKQCATASLFLPDFLLLILLKFYRYFFHFSANHVFF